MPRVPLLSGTRIVVAIGAGRRRRAAAAAAGTGDGRRGGDARGAAFPARRRAARIARRGRDPGDDRRGAAGAAGRERAGEPARAGNRRVRTRSRSSASRREQQTLLVACGLCAARASAEIAALVTPELAAASTAGWRCTTPPTRTSRASGRRAAGPRRPRAGGDRPRRRRSRAAETVLHGGPSTLLAAADAETQRRATADSLLETGGLGGLAPRDARRAVARGRVPLFGVSLVLNHPVFAGLLRGYPVRAGGGRADRALAPAARATLPRRIPCAAASCARCAARATTAAVLAGPPSVAHAEALLRAIELRGATLDEPLDALVIGIPGTTPFLPRERPNPLARRPPRARARARAVARRASRSSTAAS